MIKELKILKIDKKIKIFLCKVETRVIGEIIKLGNCVCERRYFDLSRSL